MTKLPEEIDAAAEAQDAYAKEMHALHDRGITTPVYTLKNAKLFRATLSMPDTHGRVLCA